MQNLVNYFVLSFISKFWIDHFCNLFIILFIYFQAELHLMQPRIEVTRMVNDETK